MKTFKLTFVGIAIVFLSSSFSTNRQTKENDSKFYIVCSAPFHNGERTPFFCVGTAENYDEAKIIAVDHNKLGESHNASPCSGSCPGCN